MIFSRGRDMELFPVYCNYNRDYAQVANAFIDQFEPDLNLLEGSFYNSNIYKNVWRNGEYNIFLDEMSKYIHTKESRLGEPGFVPDLTYYISEYIDECPEERGWWAYSVGVDYDPICEFLYQPLKAWNDAITELVEEEIDTENYVYDNYGIEVGDHDWPYSDIDNCIDEIFKNENQHGFQSKEDLKEIIKLMNQDYLQEEVYDGGSYGYHVVDGEDYCETGSEFLGNSEECIDFNYYGIYPLYNYNMLPKQRYETYHHEVAERSFEIMNDSCYVDNLQYGYLTLNYIIYFYYDWDDIITTALENGFEMDSKNNIIKKEIYEAD